ncbi:MAG TPA: archaetidylserine decarboxylase [Steroidobacteraceae bacterium]
MSAALQYLLPHHLLCRLVYLLTRSEHRWLKNLLIGAFVHCYAPDMSEALESEPLSYPNFNAFFTRALREGARPADPDPRRLVSPCDGTLSIAASARGHELVQAKSHVYSLEALLAAQSDWVARFAGGLYATVYLAPRDYHRVHMPLAGQLRDAWLVPGRLFSVNAATTARVPRLFARNERVICAFEGEYGPFALVLVGALFVGSMSTVWHGEVTPAAAGGVRRLVPRTAINLWQPRGAELGRFNMGSTVILLLPAGARWETGLQAGARLRVGADLGRMAP